MGFFPSQRPYSHFNAHGELVGFDEEMAHALARELDVALEACRVDLVMSGVLLTTRRWSFKPELGFSRAFGRVELDACTAVWLFTKNPEFFSRNALVPGTQSQTQEPIGAVELHLSYDVRRFGGDYQTFSVLAVLLDRLAVTGPRRAGPLREPRVASRRRERLPCVHERQRELERGAALVMRWTENFRPSTSRRPTVWPFLTPSLTASCPWREEPMQPSWHTRVHHC